MLDSVDNAKSPKDARILSFGLKGDVGTAKKFSKAAFASGVKPYLFLFFTLISNQMVHDWYYI